MPLNLTNSENEWRILRTPKYHFLELESSFHECMKKRRKIAIKVVGSLGDYAMKIIEVGMGGK